MTKRWVGLNCLFVILYVPVAELGMWLAVEPGNVTPLYPAAGIAFAAFLILGKKVLPGIFFGGMLANMVSMPLSDMFYQSLSAALMIGMGEALSVVAAGWIFHRFAHETSCLQKPKETVTLFLVCFFWLISPSIGVTALSLTGIISMGDFGFLWLTWWLGDALGIILVVPVVLAAWGFFHDRLINPIAKPIRINILALYISLIFAIALGGLPIVYLVIAATLLWVTKHYYAGALISSLVPYIVLIPLSILGIGFYGEIAPPYSFIYLQVLLAVNSFIAFYLSAILYEYNIQTRHVELVTEEADFDPLTKVLNRRGFFRKADTAIHDAEQLSLKSLLIIIDLDDFKRINENFGQEVGDEVLVRVAETIRNNTRTGDLAARFGGEEFLILLSGIDGTSAESIAGKLLDEIRSIEWGNLLSGEVLTASAGCVFIDRSENLHELIVNADHLLYRAKARGKNRVEISAFDR